MKEEKRKILPAIWLLIPMDKKNLSHSFLFFCSFICIQLSVGSYTMPGPWGPACLSLPTHWASPPCSTPRRATQAPWPSAPVPRMLQYSWSPVPHSRALPSHRPQQCPCPESACPCPQGHAQCLGLGLPWCPLAALLLAGVVGWAHGEYICLCVP